MIIGTKELLKLVNEKKLIENLSERELTNPEGAGFDLRIGELYKLSEGEGFLGLQTRKTPEVALVAEYKENESRTVEIKPGQYFLGVTVEKLNTPDNLLTIFFARTTLFRSGVQLIVSQGAPGYCGRITFGVKNIGDKPFKFEMGARFLHVLFLEVSGGIESSYRGQWQGGRVAVTNEETQV